MNLRLDLCKSEITIKSDSYGDLIVNVTDADDSVAMDILEEIYANINIDVFMRSLDEDQIKEIVDHYNENLMKG